MKTWFSEYRVRSLAEHIAPRLLPKVEAVMIQAATETIRSSLPGLLMDALRNEMGAEHTPKGSVSARRDRDNSIRGLYNGHNAAALAHKFGLSPKQIVRIGRGVK